MSGCSGEDYDRFVAIAKVEMDEKYELYSAPLQKRVQGILSADVSEGLCLYDEMEPEMAAASRDQARYFPVRQRPGVGQETRRAVPFAPDSGTGCTLSKIRAYRILRETG